MLRLPVVFCCTLLLAACSARPAPDAAPDGAITVEGDVTARGNEPFVVYVLETPMRNSYVLTLTPAQEGAFTSPARLRLTGTPYLDDWNNQPHAYLRVHTLEVLP